VSGHYCPEPTRTKLKKWWMLAFQQEQEEGMQPYLLDLDERVVQAAGGWAHSVAATG
jgi:hypothetical protein